MIRRTLIYIGISPTAPLQSLTELNQNIPKSSCN